MCRNVCGRKELYNILVFYKHNVIQRILHLILDVHHSDRRRIMRDLHRTEEYLSSRMNEVRYAWEHRHDIHNALPHYFGRYCTGSVDTFPVYVSRPKDYWWQKKLYNGKYG